MSFASGAIRLILYNVHMHREACQGTKATRLWSEKIGSENAEFRKPSDGSAP
jgi:hypothetical protein